MIKLKLYHNEKNGAMSVLVPVQLQKLLKIKTDEFILADFRKYQPTIQKVFEDFKAKNKPCKIYFGNKNQPESCAGAVVTCSEISVELFDKKQDKNLIIPYSIIIRCDEIKNSKS